MAVHQETREMPIYVMTMARPNGRPGPALMASTTDCSPEAIEARRAARAGGASPEGFCGFKRCPGPVAVRRLSVVDVGKNAVPV
jgi:hypothetical protein